MYKEVICNWYDENEDIFFIKVCKNGLDNDVWILLENLVNVN